MSVIDVTTRLAVHQRRMAIIEIYTACNKDQVLHADAFRRLNVRVMLSAMPIIGSDHGDGRVYTYRFAIPSFTKGLTSEGSLGRFHTDEAALTALTQQLDLRAVLDLRSLGIAFETYNLADTARVAYGAGGRHFSVSHGLSGTQQRWHWLQVNSMVVDKETVENKAFTQGVALAIGEAEMLAQLDAFCAGLHLPTLYGFSRELIGPPTLLCTKQRLAYYYPAATPDEYVAIFLDVCIPKAGVIAELTDMLGYLRT